MKLFCIFSWCHFLRRRLLRRYWTIYLAQFILHCLFNCWLGLYLMNLLFCWNCRRRKKLMSGLCLCFLFHCSCLTLKCLLCLLCLILSSMLNFSMRLGQGREVGFDMITATVSHHRLVSWQLSCKEYLNVVLIDSWVDLQW